MSSQTLISCACGCGEMLPAIAGNHQKRRFATAACRERVRRRLFQAEIDRLKAENERLRRSRRK